jgi:RNA polymerase sigma-70 factor (ECF subfamily)
MIDVDRLLVPTPAAVDERTPRDDADNRVRELVDRHFDAVWRLVRRLGVSSDAIDDAAQQTFLIAARKVHEIRPETERQYLFAIAVRVAADARRARSRRRELPEDALPSHVDPLPAPDELLDRKRAREVLDDILASMPLELRVAFTMFELDGLSLPEVAAVLGIPLGTATSRLRRARELFHARVQRISGASGSGNPGGSRG